MENKKVHGNTGHVVSEETREKIRQKLAGRKNGPCSLEKRQAISLAKKKSQASQDAILVAVAASAEARRGKPSPCKGTKLQPHTEEWKLANGLLHKGRKRPDSMRAKVSASKKGKPFSEAHRQALSVAGKKRVAEKGQIFVYRSKCEIRAGEILEPLGFKPQVRLVQSGHPYDYGHKDRKIMIEVNGCFWHGHDCGVKPLYGNVVQRDAKLKEDTEAQGYRFITLWQCQETDWVRQLTEQEVLC